MSKIAQLDWSKIAKQFTVNLCGKFLSQYQASRQEGKQALSFLFSLLRFLDNFQPFSLLFYWNILYFSFWTNV